MAETLRWDFVGNDRLTEILEKIDKSLDKVDRSLGDFGRKAKATAADVKIIEAEIVDLGDQAEKTDTKLKRTFRGLPAEIAMAKAAVKSLSAEFARTGDESLLKKIADERSRLSKMEGVSKNLFGDIGKEAAKAAAPAAKSFGDSFLNTLNTSFPDELKAVVLIAVGTAAVAAAPLIAGVVSGAVLGGVGAGGVVGGIALAAQDSRVQDAFLSLSGRLMSVLKDAATPFIEPLLRVPKIFEQELGAALPDVRGIFGDLSGTIEPLARGLGAMVREALPGVRSAVTASVPLINSLARAMPEIGRTLSRFFEMLADAGPGATKALLVVIRLIDGMILATGFWISLLTKAFDMLSKVPGPLQDLSKEAAEIGHSSSSSFDLISSSTEQATDRLIRFSEAYRAAFGQIVGAEHATIAYERAIDELTETLTENGRTLDVYTEKGRLNREAILRVAEAAEQERQANIARGMSVEEANAKYQAHLMWLRNTLEQMKFNKAEVEGLIGAIEELPLDVHMSFKADGLGALSAGIDGLGNKIAALAGVNVVTQGRGRRKRALGGAVMPGELYQVHEQRMEFFQPAMPGRITTSPSGGSLPDETVLAPVTIMMEGERLWSGMLAFKRRSGKVSLGLG